MSWKWLARRAYRPAIFTPPFLQCCWGVAVACCCHKMDCFSSLQQKNGGNLLGAFQSVAVYSRQITCLRARGMATCECVDDVSFKLKLSYNRLGQNGGTIIFLYFQHFQNFLNWMPLFSSEICRILCHPFPIQLLQYRHLAFDHLKPDEIKGRRLLFNHSLMQNPVACPIQQEWKAKAPVLKKDHAGAKLVVANYRKGENIPRIQKNTSESHKCTTTFQAMSSTLIQAFVS